MDYKKLLADYNRTRAKHSYAETVKILAGRWYYSVSYMRKLITKARNSHV